MKLWYKCDSNDMNSYNKYQTNIFKNKAEYTTKYCIALQLFINEPKEDRYTWRGNIWDNPFFSLQAKHNSFSRLSNKIKYLKQLQIKTPFI